MVVPLQTVTFQSKGVYNNLFRFACYLYVNVPVFPYLEVICNSKRNYGHNICLCIATNLKMDGYVYHDYWSYFYSFVLYIMMGLSLRLLLQVILQRELMATESVETNTGIKKQPGLVSPALKRIINKIKP